ncbi:MAG: ABC-2 family transporter protein, partial [Candidatus Kapabacteria bacterium]|nr:ABC-2 family transporter protein [Candidatus Kapabacteria bacterium]MDW7996346.1 ABC-2 family transporter protein [Bacteroidota bacterium]
MSCLGVYASIARVGLSAALMYRTNFLFTAGLTVVVGVTVQLFLWLAVYGWGQQTAFAGVPFAQMALYVACATLSLGITRGGRVERMVAEEIRTGELIRYLLKPITHGPATLALALSERVVTFPIVLGLALVAAWIALPWLPAQAGVERVVAAAPFLAVGIVLNFLMGLGISYLAFWMDEVWTLHVVKDISLWFLSGQLVPLSLLPHGLQMVSEWLPFQYLAYVPAG